MSGYNLKFYREQLNCSQLEMAEFLLTTRHQIAFAEAEERQLDTPCITRLAKLVQQMEAAWKEGFKVAAVDEMVRQMNVAVPKKLGRQLDKLHQSLKITRTKLLKATKAFEQAQQALHTLTYIQQKMPDLNPHQRTWIILKIQDAEKLLAANDLSVQHALDIRVKSIEASIEAANQFIDNISE